MHEDQGGGFHKNEEGTEDEETPQAHYFGCLCDFATLQWYQINDEDVEEVEEKWKMPRIKPTCCITYDVDLRSIMCATKKMNLYVLIQKLLPSQ